MNYRALIFDDQKEIRQILWSLFDSRGYEVFTFSHPAACPLSEEELCPCPTEQACTDVILSDMNMPIKNGLDFLEDQIKKGCKCKHFALMSGAFKPLKLKEVMNWLTIEKDIDQKRKLSNWFLEKTQKISEE
jgi:CheY-like chemotaxis protein